ncbi:flavonol synthase/flavanone 3-hydroxylase [Leucogyrophana mollusca]|uniref:Flavonol synthase/flavanone 3-hydroxylase n=1 Tax=Leucogyrophana mollusca TaxID=85980 RepID=A0ACB8B4X9_9AGAM|nr:flavonol synthase/flavanone 3-hydroxylase [Leucogyrophana mollusca]
MDKTCVPLNAEAETSLPIIDFANFGDGTSVEAKEIAEKFYAACRDVGFAYIANTGIPQHAIDGMFELCAKFFDLPTEIKQKAPHPPEGWKHRGYSGVGVEQVSQMVFDPNELADIRSKALDFKESFDFGNEDSTRLQNIWPPEEDLPGFREQAVAFFKVCREFQTSKILPALALGMPGVPAGFFDQYHQQADNQVRLLHYPGAPAEAFLSGEKGRINAHTDFGTCTVLFQDDCGGLEVESPHEPGKFIPAPPIPGTVVFNIGDFLMRWSNDTLKSTLHRVRVPPQKDGVAGGMIRERFSIPYFMGADRDKVVDCLPGCFGPNKPKRYEPINAGQYINMRLNATY